MEGKHPLTVAISCYNKCYNKADTIRRAIRSVVEQEDVEPEVIVVDDASEDQSRAIINEELDAYSGPGRLITLNPAGRRVE